MDDRLQKFAVLVETGSFTQTAKKLHISQPALTLAINKLERELRASLLIRSRRQLELTPAGRIAYKAAVEHRTVNENLRTRLVELARKRPKVVVGMIDSVAAALSETPEPLDELEAQADVSVIVNNSRYLRAAVGNREIDVAFVVRHTVGHPALDTAPVGAEPFVLICRPDLAEAAQTKLDRNRLPGFICYDPQSTTYGHISRGLRQLGITPRPILHSTSPDVMLNMALRGRGVAALPRLLTADLLSKGRLTALKQGRRVLILECPLSAVTPKGRVMPEVLKTFTHKAEIVLDSLNRR